MRAWIFCSLYESCLATFEEENYITLSMNYASFSKLMRTYSAMLFSSSSGMSQHVSKRNDSYCYLFISFKKNSDVIAHYLF